MNDNLNNPTNLDYNPLTSPVEAVEVQKTEVIQAKQPATETETDYSTYDRFQLQGVELSLTDQAGVEHKFNFDSKRLKFGKQLELKAKNSRGMKFKLIDDKTESEADMEKMQIGTFEIVLELIYILFAIPRDIQLNDFPASEMRAFMEVVETADPLRLKTKAKTNT